MRNRPILVVDDERNIRLTMSQALEALDMTVSTAVNGEEALHKLSESQFGLVFLDLKMPGMDGLEVLRRIKESWPRTRVIIITAHGSIESAVEAMKLGAVDFVQKPFSAGEIRDLAKQVLAREDLDEESAADYRTLIELAKRHITDRRFGAARDAALRAIAAEPGQPEAYNLLGSVQSLDRIERQLELLCPYLYYTTTDSGYNVRTCGAYMDRLVLGPRLLHELCETENHLHCEYFLNPRLK
ncbi:MAG: response regulator [Thermodesulfobacteriota bacterium]